MKTPLRFLLVAALMAATWAYMSTHKDRSVPLSRPFSGFPAALGEWKLFKDSQLDQQTLDMLLPTDYMFKRYTRADGAKADLYVAYHDGAERSGGIHSPRNCLPGAGWFEVSSEEVKIPVADGQNLDAVVAVYQHGASSEVLLYWFQVGGKAVSNEYAMKIQEVLNSARYGRRDAAFVRIAVPITGSKESAVEQAREFLRTALPSLRQHLPS